MYRLSFTLNYVPIHNKYRSYLFQFWTSDKDEIYDKYWNLIRDFVGMVGEDLESSAYARDLIGEMGVGVQEVEYNPDLEGESHFEVEHH
jgi:hypothetical protein